jgi:hypothetical protein
MIKGYTYHTSKFGAAAPSPVGEGWGEEIQKNRILKYERYR